MISPILWLLAAPVLVALTVYCAELAFGLKPLVSTPVRPFEGSFAVLVPAHNEASGIAATLTCLKQEILPNGRVLVIADNCNDETAKVARQVGAEVIERRDLNRRGKGFALDYGRAHLAVSPPATVVVLDADCTFRPGSLARLLGATMDGRPAQALYLLAPNLNATPLVQISNFAFVVKNLVRHRGLTRLGGGSTLTGTGMAFPWGVFADAPLATSNIVEDLSLSVALAKSGVRIKLVEDAVVRSAAADEADTSDQRRRWEHGYLDAAFAHAPPLIFQGLLSPSRVCLAVGLDLLVPPLALLFLLAGCLMAAFAGLEATTGYATPLRALILLTAGAGSLTVVSWVREGQSWLSMRHLVKAPLYIAWKIPLYLRFLISRETQWIRTRRDGEG